jgi:hypothetical protein
LSASALSRSVGPALDVETLGERFDLAGVTADQDRIRHHAIAVFERHPA